MRHISRKDLLGKQFSLMQKRYGTKDFAFHPMTYVLPEDYKNLVKIMAARYVVPNFIFIFFFTFYLYFFESSCLIHSMAKFTKLYFPSWWENDVTFQLARNTLTFHVEILSIEMWKVKVLLAKLKLVKLSSISFLNFSQTSLSKQIKVKSVLKKIFHTLP